MKKKYFVKGILTTIMVVIGFVIAGFATGNSWVNGGAEMTVTFGTNGVVVDGYNDITGVTLCNGHVEINY